ncbi:helix-turn-helix transcriptional regulator [Marinilactibacillus sp. GCM10026970]|uniref:helix-turn-helix transcriptional regulator n=1 Tax=Marinilactibacillus sp. GCM10026970 TaxID=3252642 RepID=UPI00361F54D9
MKKIERLISMVMILLQKEKVSAKEFSELFNVTKRTIQRDIETLGYANIPIYAELGAAGGYALMEEYKFDKRLLTHEDIENMLIALSGFEELIADRQIQATIQKIKGMMAMTVSPKLALSFYQWVGRNEMQEEVSLINEAIQHNWLLKLTYIDREGHKSQRVVEPYRMQLNELHWYLVAYSLEREAYRTFKLTRILSIEKAGYFTSRTEPTYEKQLTKKIEQKVTEVQLSIALEVRDQFVERYGKRVIGEVENGKCMASIPLPENRYAFQFLTGFGNKIKVLGPEEFRQQYILFLKQALDVYET